MTDLVDDFIYALSPMLGKPFAFFGHSMGALTAYEVACALRDRGMPQPSRLLLSAFRAPHLPSANIKIYHLPDEVLRIVLAKDGISPDILASDELMQAILPTLRADLELCDTYEHEVRKPLDVPISAYGGEQDIRVRPEDLVGWRDHTTSSFELTTFPGDHFYLQPAVNELVGDVRQRLSSSFHTEASIHGGDVA